MEEGRARYLIERGKISITSHSLERGERRGDHSLRAVRPEKEKSRLCQEKGHGEKIDLNVGRGSDWLDDREKRRNAQ